MGYLLNDQLGLDTIHAGQVVAATGLLAVDTTGTAVEVHLYDIVGRLVPTQETSKRMSSSPDAYDWCSCQRC